MSDREDAKSRDKADSLGQACAAEELDPRVVGEKVWQALEQVAEEEEKERIEKAREFHPEPPVELPDISNL